MSKGKVGFIGLGDMGKPMARRLLRHGFEVSSAAHVARQAIEELMAEGLTEAASPARVAANAETVITMVRDTEHLAEFVHSKITGLEGVRRTESTLGVNFIKHDYRMARIVS